MAPGGPGLQNPAPNAPNGATATHLMAFLILGSFLREKLCLCHRDTVSVPQRHCVCATETLCLCHRESVCLCYREICGFYGEKHQKIA